MKKSIIIIALILSSFLFLFLAQKINLPASDIGRHIKNGEVLLNANEYKISRSALLHTNFFSYTYPDFPFINHHWGYGIFVYLIYIFFGWTGLSLSYILSIIIAFIILFLLSSKKTPLYASIPISIFLIPLIAERTEVRPEGLSYIFIAIFLYILVSFSENKIPKKYLYSLPILTILWVNVHIYAIFSPLLIGAFLCESIIRKDWEKVKIYITFITLSALALLISPYGLEGAIYPFKIFENYGYLVAENQSIPFLEKLNFINPNYLWWKISTFFVFMTGISALFVNKKKFPIALGFITLAFSLLSFFGTRHLTLFGFILIPFFSSIAYLFSEKISSDEDKQNAWVWSIIISIFLTIFICFRFSSHLPGKGNWGLGLLPQNIDSVTFVEKNRIQGPFFSNYDIGGLIIFSLFTPEKKERVFVDNRPESYPKEFFKDIYIPMQENINVWEKISDQYNFNAIWFYRLDSTPWAQNFLVTHINDPLWAPVYVDGYTIIFLKRNEINDDIIKQFELPKSMFSIN
ncbi:MAG: hypothetical protein ACYCZW_02400 [Minisyncoccota bacterium]